MTSDSGIELAVHDVGAAIAGISVPAASGPANVVLGYNDVTHYLDDPYYVGATVGRYANRIANATARVAGQTLKLDANETATGNCLHGGRGGLHSKRWLVTNDDNAITCRHTSPHGDQGFPGSLDVAVIYRFDASDALSIEFVARTDRDTIVNIVNHAYFNLDPGATTIDGHELSIESQMITPTDTALIPTGEIRPVASSRYDFRKPRCLNPDDAFDINYVIDGTAGELRPAARLSSPLSGIEMQVLTTQPGLQLYTGDHLGGAFVPRQGLCLETQNFPDAPNRAGFPSALLRPGEEYRQRTVLVFTTRE